MTRASGFLAFTTRPVLAALPALLTAGASAVSCADGGADPSDAEPTASTGSVSAGGPATATSGAASTTGGGCLAEQDLCSGVCTAVASDAMNCGSCGVMCAQNELCSAGVCSSNCGAGLTPCGQSCVDVESDSANCGGCDMACGLGQVCAGGVCMAGATMGAASTSDATSSTPATGSQTTGNVSTGNVSTGGAGGTTNTMDGGTLTGTTGSVDDGECMTPPPAPPLVGWASEGGGTEGGGNASPVVVSSASELNSALSGSEARVIHLNGSVSGDFEIESNKTLIGVCGGEIRGSVRIDGVQNIIMRNLRVVGYNCSDSPQECGAGADAINVQGSSNLWFDHLDVSDGSDGNLDMTNASDYITISWTKFSYSTRRTDPEQGESGHRFSNLIGSSDSDSGEYRITFHHNWWADNVDQRMPRTRFGDIHVFNNLFTASGNSYCTNAGISTRILVENNIYRGVNNPLSPDDNGDMLARGNVFEDVTGNQDDNGGQGFDPAYDYTLDSTAGLDAILQNEVGPHD